jgi:hypothetical protein
MPNPNPQKANQQPGKSLEALVHAKNKRLREELIKLRVGFTISFTFVLLTTPKISHGEMEATLQAITDTLAHTRADLDKQKSLNERLETDLLQLNPHVRPASSSVVPNGATGSGTPTPAETGLDGLNLGAPKDSSPSGTRSGTPAIPFTSSADTSILPIVTNQRDRFRQRNAELEEVILLLFCHHIILKLLTPRNCENNLISSQIFGMISSLCNKTILSCTRKSDTCIPIEQRRGKPPALRRSQHRLSRGLRMLFPISHRRSTNQ